MFHRNNEHFLEMTDYFMLAIVEELLGIFPLHAGIIQRYVIIFDCKYDWTIFEEILSIFEVMLSIFEVMLSIFEDVLNMY